MAKTKIIDYVGFGLAAFGVLLFPVMYLIRNVSTEIGQAFMAFFFLASVVGAAYFGHKIWLV